MKGRILAGLIVLLHLTVFGAVGRADQVSWAFEGSINPDEFHPGIQGLDVPSNSLFLKYASMKSLRMNGLQGDRAGDATISIASIAVKLVGPEGIYYSNTNFYPQYHDYSLNLKLIDTGSGDSADFTVTGYLTGEFDESGDGWDDGTYGFWYTAENHYRSATSLTAALGGHLYEVTFGDWAFPSGDVTIPVDFPGFEGGSVVASVRVTDTPEPATVTLGVVGVLAAGCGFIRTRRSYGLMTGSTVRANVM